MESFDYLIPAILVALAVGYRFGRFVTIRRVRKADSRGDLKLYRSGNASWL